MGYEAIMPRQRTGLTNAQPSRTTARRKTTRQVSARTPIVTLHPRSLSESSAGSSYQVRIYYHKGDLEIEVNGRDAESVLKMFDHIIQVSK